MSESSSFKSAGKVVRLDRPRGGSARISSSVVRDGSPRPALTVVPDLKPAQGPSMVPDKPTSRWSWFVMFFMDGFALYGAMVAGVSLAHQLDHAEAAPARAPGNLQTAKGRRGRAVLSLLVTEDHNTKSQFGSTRKWLPTAAEAPAEIVKIAPAEQEQDETVWSNWRRERRVRKAALALAALDDWTLRDIGIPDRSQIEWVVRYCYDC